MGKFCWTRKFSCPTSYADLVIFKLLYLWNEKRYWEVVNCILVGIKWSFLGDNKITTQISFHRHFKLRKRNDLYIFVAGRGVRKFTCLTAKFKEDPIEPLQEIAWRSYGIWRTFQFWLLYCWCYAEFVSAILFNQIMFTVTWIAL